MPEKESAGTAVLLVWVAMVALGLLILTLGSTFLAIWLQLKPKDDLLNLARLLFSWQVVAGGLTIGAGSTFRNEIKALLLRFAR